MTDQMSWKRLRSDLNGVRKFFVDGSKMLTFLQLRREDFMHGKLDIKTFGTVRKLVRDG